MANRRATHRVALNAEDDELLARAAALFGMNRSEVVRRLLRGAMEISPAFNAESSQKLAELSHQLRLVGRNLAQMLRAINEGRVIGQDNTEQVWEALLNQSKEIDAEISRMIRAHGLRLRRSAKLEEVFNS